MNDTIQTDFSSFMPDKSRAQTSHNLLHPAKTTELHFKSQNASLRRSCDYIDQNQTSEFTYKNQEVEKMLVSLGSSSCGRKLLPGLKSPPRAATSVGLHRKTQINITVQPRQKAEKSGTKSNLIKAASSRMQTLGNSDSQQTQELKKEPVAAL